MTTKDWTGKGEIRRIHIDRREREEGYLMPSHHAHPYFEICCIESGSCRFLIEDMLYDLVEGDFLLIPPQIFHYTRYLFGPCKRCGIYFRFADLDKAVIEQMPGQEAFFSQMKIMRIPEPGREQCMALLERMNEEEETRDARSPLLLRLRLQELLLLCSRDAILLQDEATAIRASDKQVLLAAHFINEHFRQQIGSAEIAAAVGFSPNYLSRKFREAVGIGVHEYLVFVRLRSAAMELISTDNSITYVATHCGFSDSNYFKDVFKRKYGVTPREYRSRYRRDELRALAPAQGPGSGGI